MRNSILAVVSVLTATLSAGAANNRFGTPSELSASQVLETFRDNGDLRSQRRHIWTVFAELTRTMDGQDRPVFESWYGEDQVFASGSIERAPNGIRSFSRSDRQGAAHVGGVPILTYTLYNDAAYRHVRANGLNRSSELERLRATGTVDRAITGNRSIPPFPRQAMVLKTVWWPVAQDAITALPVWDPELNPVRPSGNGYTSWQRAVAINPLGHAADGSTHDIAFAGRTFSKVRQFDLAAFHHIVLDARLAERLMRDRESRSTAFIALGRTLKAGDSLVLVGANLATKELSDWIWAAFWWHDLPDQGPFAADRPERASSKWSSYLMQVAFDSSTPTEPDGGAHICFNPWLEGRFPDGGGGGGTSSNCLACHRRASYPAANFLPITRGGRELTHDPAYAAGQLRTSFLWSIAMHAGP
jgi:hypothetical protein